MRMKFSEKQKYSVFTLFLCSTWYFQDSFVTGENQGILLHKVSSHDLVEMETTPCLIKTVNVLNRLECTYRCNKQLPECAAIYYNDVLGLCKLLRCRPTDKLGNQNLVGIPSGWEIWEDSQACKIGWAFFAGHCYYFSVMGTKWNNAQAYCNSSNATLIEIYSQTEEDWVKDSFLLPETGVETQCSKFWHCSLWIGSYRNPITSIISYNSGKSILYPKWDLFEPDNRNGNENCVALFRLKKLHDFDFETQCSKFWHCSLWIGSYRNPITSIFSYNSGKSILYPKWDLFQPDNRNGNENCVALFRLQKLHDFDCNFNDFQYICKMKN